MGKKDELKKVLIVDDEEDMIWSLQKNLNNETLQVETLTASSGEEALEVLKKTPIDLIITDIRMSGISGIELLIEVRNKYPSTGVIVMTAYPSPEAKTEAIVKGSLYFLEKPFDINDMRDVVRHALKDDSLFKGTVAGVELTDIIQINSLSRTTSTLMVKTANGDGMIFFKEGSVVHAICDDLEGEEAFFKILGFTGGTLESKKVSAPPAITIKKPIEALLIEGARRLDEESEMGRNNGELPEDEDDEQDEIIEIAEMKEEGLLVSSEEIEEAINEQPATKEEEEPQTAGDDQSNNNEEEQKIDTEEEENMEDLKKVLSEFTNIPGVHTACLVGRDGFLLDSIALSGVDTEMVGAIASGGFGSSETMGTQLGKGSLTMTMIEYDNGPVMFSPIGTEAFLVIVADKDSNLGMIRLKIKKHSKEIEETASI